MPQIKAQNTSALSINLAENGPLAFSPGNTIVGSVIRRTHIISPMATVTVRLLGRAKAKMAVRRGKGTHQYRARFNFWGPDDVCQVLFNGPVHIPRKGGENVWQFAITIPLHASVNSVLLGGVQNDRGKDNSFLSLRPASVANYPLPFSFFAIDYSDGPGFDAYVEYHLEAEIRYSLAGGNNIETETAIHPIRLIPRSIDPPVSDFQLQRFGPLDGIIATQRLLPGMENAGLTFRQKTQKLFGSTKVPRFAYALELKLPSVVQLDSPTPIPLLLRVIPNREQTTDLIVDTPRDMTLVGMKLEILANTSVLCPGGMGPYQAAHTQIINLPCDTFVPSILDAPIVLPSGPNAAPLDVGALLQLQLREKYLLARGQSYALEHQVYPTFKTYCVRLNNRLRWAFTVGMAGETHTFVGKMPLVVLAPGLEEFVPVYPGLDGPAEPLPGYSENHVALSTSPPAAVPISV